MPTQARGATQYVAWVLVFSAGLIGGGSRAETAASAPGSAPASASAAPPRASATRPSYRADSPAQWLSTQGKLDRWIDATERCRELLDRLEPADPRVKAYTPNLRRQAEVISRVDGFTWKTITAVEFLENALEDLIAGKTPNQRYAGKQLAFAYWSDRMQRIEAVWMHVPASYTPGKSHPLFMYYKSGGGIHYKDGKAAGGYRPTAEMSNKTDTFHAWSSLNIQVKGRLGSEIELEEFPAALAREFSVDPDRVFLTGYSDGGFTALWLATHYPHLVAGIAPSVANWQYTNVEQVNLLNVPYLVVDGWGDSGYVEMNFLRFLSLANMGYDVSAVFGQHGHSYAPFEDEQAFQHIMKWASTKTRNVWPRHVRYATWNLAWNRAYWVSIERMTSPYLPAQIDAEIEEGNRVEVTAGNVAAYRLRLSDTLVQVDKPLVVLTNGKETYRGPVKGELRIELEPRPAGRFVKDASMPDDVTAQIAASTYDARGYLQVPDRRWLFVKGTAGDSETQEALGRWYPDGAKADKDITDADLATFNLILYGGPAVNKVTARIADSLPVHFTASAFEIGGVRYDQPSHCVAFLHPNPLNPRKYVIVYAFNDAATFMENKQFDLADFANAWKFRTGDCLVAGIPAEANQPGVVPNKGKHKQRHIIFDAAWKADTNVIAKLPQSLDRKQILQLQAEAIRQAAQADVGIIWQDAPDYLRWTDCLRAGPITLADLATIDALPQYIMTGEMSGKELLKVRPAASTLRASEGESAADEQGSLAADAVVPEKTYKVAMGSYGIPAYRTNPGKMPKLFTFGSEQEFLANENNGLMVHNLRQTRIDVTEALSRHLQKQALAICTKP